MGYSLPAAIGASFSDRSRSVTCIIGDGGLMVCLAELATVAKHELPIRIFLFNNHSHGIQKQTLETWLKGRFVSVDPSSGLAFPNQFTRVAEALGVPSVTIDGSEPIAETLARIYAEPGPIFVNVEINPDQKLYPVLKYGAPLENQSPLLPPAIVAEQMIIPPYENAVLAPLVSQQSSPGW
jgi:acetolactate synthase-1/2/3 large subunit